MTGKDKPTNWSRKEEKIYKYNKNNYLGGIMKLDIYKAREGSWDTFDFLATIEAETAEECEETAEANYGSNDNEYHWTNCY
jgi:hypothetical protein